MGDSTTGTCGLCGHKESSAGMALHVATCVSAHDAAGSPAKIVQVRVEAAGDPRYWLYLEALADAPLLEIDRVLRRTWLECCDHLSGFRIGRAELPVRSKVGHVLPRKGLEFTHEYDFGSTTTLRGVAVGLRQGDLGDSDCRLLARNDPLPWTCSKCKKPATLLCPDCIYTGDCLFCDTHSRRHPCGNEETYRPVVNSPRMGVCGYTGTF